MVADATQQPASSLALLALRSSSFPGCQFALRRGSPGANEQQIGATSFPAFRDRLAAFVIADMMAWARCPLLGTMTMLEKSASQLTTAVHHRSCSGSHHPCL
jgi:hypothetical protein